MSNPHNLHSQIEATQQEIQDAERIAATQDAKRRRGRRNALHILAAILLLGGGAALIAQKDDLRYWLLGPSVEMVHADLNALLTAAAESVDDYRRRNGALPDEIPLPGAGSLVTYRRTDDGHYTLKAALGPISREQTY